MSNKTNTTNPTTAQRKKKVNVRKMASTAILAAVSTVLMFLSFNVPFMPSFIKFDFSELPALIAAFAFGPVSGVAVCLVKNLINLATSMTMGIGELSNFILGCFFVIPAGLCYKHRKTQKTAVIGAAIGSLAGAVLSFFSNYFIVYPIYENLMPLEIIIKAYSAIVPSITSLWQAILFFNVPFTFAKFFIDTVITFFIYKYISPILKGKV